MKVLNMRDPGTKALVRADRAMYIGRGYNKCTILNTPPGQRGWLGNPHPVGEMCPICKVVHKQGEAADAYLVELTNRCEYDPDFFAKLQYTMLNVEALACWCAPKRCHGNVIIEFWEGMND